MARSDSKPTTEDSGICVSCPVPPVPPEPEDDGATATRTSCKPSGVTLTGTTQTSQNCALLSLMYRTAELEPPVFGASCPAKMPLTIGTVRSLFAMFDESAASKLFHSISTKPLN